MPDNNTLLLYLAKKGIISKQLELSTTKIAQDIQSTQQTISRKLVELEEQGFVERVASTRGIKLTITQKGMEYLKEWYAQLKSVFNEKKDSLTGTIESGLGEGAYYISLKEYQDQFKKKVGIEPYPGTLNLRVDYTEFLQFVSAKEKIAIEGFTLKNRTFGGLAAYKVKINQVNAAIILPERTSHTKDTIEIIAHEFLREQFRLKDGDELEIHSEHGT